MNLTGAAAGAAARGQWTGSGAASLSCNPRKFSEKIALQIQRQAEDIAAFQEVMTDITSTRVSPGLKSALTLSNRVLTWGINSNLL